MQKIASHCYIVIRRKCTNTNPLSVPVGCRKYVDIFSFAYIFISINEIIGNS